MNTLDSLYELTEKELKKLVDKGTLSREELKTALDAVCLMHKIKHFDMDGEKYGWDEDGDMSMRSRPTAKYHMPSYSGNDPMNWGRSYNGMDPMTRTGWPASMGGNQGAKEELISDAQRMMQAAVNDQERMAIINYINRLNS